ncbi:MAG TPA: nicotinate phosphoribosyltransferase [Bryobacteraceae bacterium]|jgi:nicotinate phosphoribosyltransferase
MNECDLAGGFSTALFTDLYELTMAQAYDAEHMEDIAVFELSFRELSETRNYIVAAGLESVLAYLSGFHFTDSDLTYLSRRGEFSSRFLDRLRSLAFTGEVYAMPEGTVVFPHEPLIQVVAPILEAQLFETFVLNQIHFESVLAAKASRVVTAAQGRMVVDFGSRRSHGVDAALKVARATYLAGGHGTSNVMAGRRYDIPVFGTMAHSYIQAHHDEYGAFEAFEKVYPETTLLVDTYDTLHGVSNVIRLSQKLRDRFRVRAVRLDSGDLGTLAIETRKLLDEAGLRSVKIFASSGLDEYKIQRLVDSGAPIEGFGVGTSLAVSEDAPALDMAYKLVEYAGKGRLKLSTKKVLYPGRKQVFRQFQSDRIVRDIIARFDESLPGKPLLEKVFQPGHPIHHPRLSESRQLLRDQLERLPAQLLELSRPESPYPIVFSDRLQADLATRRSEIAAEHMGA